MKTSILSARVEFVEQPFLKPLQLSSGLITKATEARVRVVVRVQDREACGRGSIYLSDLWAWPGEIPTREEKDAAMRALCEEIAANLESLCGGETVHPLELGLRLHHAQTALAPNMPLLARSVCASPFDAAIHDAAGQALGLSAFRLYETDAAIPSADSSFAGEGAVSAIRRLLRPPVNQLNAWWIVGARDHLEKGVRPAIARNGIHCFKLKTLGADNNADAARTSEVFQTVRSWGVDPTLSVDSNEGNPSAEGVLDYLERLESLDPAAYAALAYLEQPTARDIVANPHDWRIVADRKPVLLDEGLTSLELLPVAREQRWSGLALKTCKGHSFNLVAAAWALQNGLPLMSLQDLTNPGFAAIHSFLFGAHVATINGVELNSPQYTPAANRPWLPSLAGLLEPTGGVHQLAHVTSPGLGSTLVEIL